MTYSFIHCPKCKCHTAHCKPSAQSPHYCMRHEKEKLRHFDMADRMADLKSLIKPFPLWERVTAGRN